MFAQSSCGWDAGEHTGSLDPLQGDCACHVGGSRMTARTPAAVALSGSNASAYQCRRTSLRTRRAASRSSCDGYGSRGPRTVYHGAGTHGGDGLPRRSNAPTHTRDGDTMPTNDLIASRIIRALQESARRLSPSSARRAAQEPGRGSVASSDGRAGRRQGHARALVSL